MAAVPFKTTPPKSNNAAQQESGITDQEEPAEEPMLDLALFSDTHLGSATGLKAKNLIKGLDNLTLNFPGIDALLFSGDLSNSGKLDSLTAFYQTILEHSPVSKFICAGGNHDIGHSKLEMPEARNLLVELFNQYSGEKTEHVYYSTDVKGYKVIVLCDDLSEKKNRPLLSQEQIDFLDKELADGTKDAKPVFVICHWPLAGTNGLAKLWKNGGVNEEQTAQIKNILRKYNNVFFISGHTHGGITNLKFDLKHGYSYVEREYGVTYLSLPAFGAFNRHCIFSPSLFVHLEVFEDHVTIVPSSLRSLKLYPDYDRTVELNTESGINLEYEPEPEPEELGELIDTIDAK